MSARPTQTGYRPESKPTPELGHAQHAFPVDMNRPFHQALNTAAVLTCHACCCCCCCPRPYRCCFLLLPLDATIANQVTKLNQAFSGALTFVTQNVYRYEVTDNIPLGACQNPSCYVPGTPILIDYQGWWDTTNNGHNHAPIYGDPNDDVTLQNALEGNLVIKGNSGSLINVFMWDW
jgi:hypothetical protein